MPYGLKKGKDKDPKYEQWMSNCVKKVKGSNPKMDEGRAIAICKAQLDKMDYDIGKASLEIDFILTNIGKKV